jgi:hypothetical protein
MFSFVNRFQITNKNLEFELNKKLCDFVSSWQIIMKKNNNCKNLTKNLATSPL